MGGNIIEPIRVDGLREFQQALKELDGESQKALRLVMNKAADLVTNTARGWVPRKTGKAAASLKSSSSQRESRVKGGSAGAPYFPWLDFGGRVGPGKSQLRQFRPGGRYIYPAYSARQKDVEYALNVGLADMIAAHGLDLDLG